MSIILTLVLQFTVQMYVYTMSCTVLLTLCPPSLSLFLSPLCVCVCVCVQGQKKAECVGFVSREGQAKKFVCYIFKAASKAMVSHHVLGLSACVYECGIMSSNFQGYNGGWAKGHLYLEISITTYMYMYIFMRDEKEGRKKQARSNKQQGKATQYTQGSHFAYTGKFRGTLVEFTHPIFEE